MPVTITRTNDIETCRRLRRQVFIHEQGVPEEDEIDDLDGQAIHLLATLDGVAIGSARLLVTGVGGKIGRVCVLKSARGSGIGSELILAAIDQFRSMPGIARVKLGSQTHAVGFYEKLGFSVIGEQYDDAGIPHRDMMLTL